MKLAIKMLVAFGFLMTMNLGLAQVEGDWKTIDEEGNAKSIVKIYKKGDVYEGKIVKVFRKDPDAQKHVGTVIIKNMKKYGNEWSGGTIYSPIKDKTYDGKLWLEDGNLMVRGYVGWFFRTQTWVRP